MEATTGATNFFGEGSPYLNHPLLTPERTSRDIDEIEEVVGPSAGRRVLDLGCGFGRHSIEFAARQAEVLGVDPSPTMIADARRRAEAAGLFVDFATIAAQDLTEVGRYDVAVSLFTSLGQLPRYAAGGSPDEGLHRSWLDAARRALRPGGWLVVEVPERDRAVAALVAREMLGPPGSATEVTRRFDDDQSAIVERFATAAGSTFELAYRVFGREELLTLLGDRGFEVAQVLDRALVPPPPTFVTVFARRQA